MQSIYYVLEADKLVLSISVISKVFEICFLNVLTRLIVNDDLQFGCTIGKRGQNALLVTSTEMNNFNERDSNVFIARLDVLNAFDSVNHCYIC